MLFPARVLLLLLSSTMAAFALLPLMLWNYPGSSPLMDEVFLLYGKVAVFAIGLHVRYHGRKPEPKEPHIFVSNHTSVNDYAVASACGRAHAVVAQGHGGFFGVVQRFVLRPLTGSLTFDRNENRDRVSIAHLMRDHVKDPARKPLLIFPEGTCVNNEYTVLFHKGAFELGCLVCPIAIKYSKAYGDPYFNTREQTFTGHLVYLMTRWCMPVDVYWIEPQRIRQDETVVAFADRVKALISDRARLKNLSWDGYLKNYRPTTEKQAKMRAKTRQEYEGELRRKIRMLRTLEKQGSNGMSSSTTPIQAEPAVSDCQLPAWLSDDARTAIQNEIIRNSFQEIDKDGLLAATADEKIVASKASIAEKVDLFQKELSDTWQSVSSLTRRVSSTSSSLLSRSTSSSSLDEKESLLFELN
jgi:1-acyl-sn-glycerol-3-phosphate acyltransferase